MLACLIFSILSVLLMRISSLSASPVPSGKQFRFPARFGVEESLYETRQPQNENSYKTNFWQPQLDSEINLSQYDHFDNSSDFDTCENYNNSQTFLEPNQEGKESWYQPEMRYDSLINESYPLLDTSSSALPARSGQQLDLEDSEALERQQRAKMAEIYQSISSYWPMNLTSDILQRYISMTRAWLEEHPLVVQGLLNDDQKAWEATLYLCGHEYLKEKCKMQDKYIVDPLKRIYRRGRTGWIAGKIDPDDKDRIYKRLSQRWDGASKDAIEAKLVRYAKIHGKIQSPEPLLYGDEKTFGKAADIVKAGASRHPGKRHPEAGTDDILQRYSPAFSVVGPDGNVLHMPYDSSHIKWSSRRFKTGQSWMEKKSLSLIDEIHKRVSSHWVQTRFQNLQVDYLSALNEYLENNRESLQKIQEEDDYEAWKVAKEIVRKSHHMKNHVKYESSNLL